MFEHKYILPKHRSAHYGAVCLPLNEMTTEAEKVITLLNGVKHTKIEVQYAVLRSK
jgi:hypothetical protein